MGYARTVKAATAAAAAVLVAAGVRFVGPAAAGYVAEELPRAQAAAATWLTPPFLYLVINAIIITIAASRFQTNRKATAHAAAVAEESESAPVVTMAMVVPVPQVQAPEAVAMDLKAAPGPAPVPLEEETLESTWKAITEGRAPPLARHLKKSDTWESRPGRRPSGDSEEAAPPATMRKAETFNDGAGGVGGRKIRREPSLGQDELNGKVEAFINKIKMEMRLQRQESLKHYNDMVAGRGGHY